MKSVTSLCHRGCRAGVAVLAVFAALAIAVAAEPVPHLQITQPGGMPGWPVITRLDRTSNGMTVHWDGPQGYYRLMQKKGLNDKNWTQVGGPMLGRQTNVIATSGSAFFKILGPSPRYAGAQVCAQCHENVHTNAMHTRHSTALQTLKNINQHNNPSCLPCHTVGYGLPTGFKSESSLPNLAGVQCESCHGPAAAHAANEEDPTLRPRKDIAAQVCGGCHTGSHHPTYDEFSASRHFNVTEDMSRTTRVDSCGRCHSGSVRLAMLDGVAATNMMHDANVGITCVVCHNPHKNTAHPAQLRNPVASTNDFVLTTRTNFLSAYDENVNICAQCHNHRGASYTSGDRPPHHSPQYNMLLGTVGELPSGAAASNPAAHGTKIEKQCVACHMQKEEYASEAQPAVTGHSFHVESYNSCLQCHPFPELLTTFTMISVSNQVQQLKVGLDLWATTKAPMELRKYGVRAWEYTNPGSLSGGTNAPSAAEQALIPTNIQKARFNLYLVQYDGSFGVHNGPHAISLLEAARAWIQTELNK